MSRIAAAKAKNQNIAPLPQDFNKVVSDYRKVLIKIFAFLKAFFTTKPKKNFWKDVDVKYLNLSHNEKLALYKNLKSKKPEERAFIELTGYESSEMKGDDMLALELFEVTLEGDVKEIGNQLNKIKENSGKNYYPVLLVLKGLAKKKNSKKDILQLIEKEINSIPENKRGSLYNSNRNKRRWKIAAIACAFLALGLLGVRSSSIFSKKKLVKPIIDYFDNGSTCSSLFDSQIRSAMGNSPLETIKNSAATAASVATKIEVVITSWWGRVYEGAGKMGNKIQDWSQFIPRTVFRTMWDQVNNTISENNK